MIDTDGERLLSDIEIAVKYRCSIWQVGKDRRAGKLRAVDIRGGGRKFRYRASDVRAWAQRHVTSWRPEIEAEMSECCA